MRTTTVLAVMLLLSGTAPAASRATRTGSCCLKIEMPGVSAEAVCRLVHFQVRPRRFGTRRICRLIGGVPPRNGGCTCGG